MEVLIVNGAIGERRRFVLLDGETKRIDERLPDEVYQRVGRFGSDYVARRKISPAREESR